MQFYSDPSRQDNPYSLPNCEAFQLTPAEQIEYGLWDQEAAELMRTPEHKLASMNSTAREDLVEALIDLHEIRTAWFWRFCLPGCMPDSDLCGPYSSAEEAIADCRDMYDPGPSDDQWERGEHLPDQYDQLGMVDDLYDF